MIIFLVLIFLIVCLAFGGSYGKVIDLSCLDQNHRLVLVFNSLV